MKKQTTCIYKMEESKEKEIWNKAIFVFDTSAILDLYFIPIGTRKNIYNQVFDKLPTRLWTPSQVEYEYEKNREKSIKNPISEKYTPLKSKISKITKSANSEILTKIEEIINETKKDDKHPFIEQSQIETFKTVVVKFLKNLNEFETTFSTQIDKAAKEILEVEQNDDVLEALKEYFEVGREFTFNEILEITKEGKHRYEFKIPPGYGDLNQKGKKGTQIFGDLILWKQILEFSKKKKLPIIFITNDIKKDDDWCYIDKSATEDRILMPREELIKELNDHSDVNFWMYNLPQFLYKSNEYLKSTIEEEAIKNISLFLDTKHKKTDLLKFKCNKCGGIHKYHKDNFYLNFNFTSSSDRYMGLEKQYQAQEHFTCVCGNGIEAIFEVYEYPTGSHNFNSVEIEGGEIIECFDFTVDFTEFRSPDICVKCGEEFYDDSNIGTCQKCEDEWNNK